MAQIQFEQPIVGETEQMFADSLKALVDGFKNAEDCRTISNTVRRLVTICGVRMVVGCGGSHIYIHREHQFKDGNHTDADNIRWAIITD